MKVFPLAQNPGAVVQAALNGPLTVTEAANYIAAIRYAEADAMLVARVPAPEVSE